MSKDVSIYPDLVALVSDDDYDKVIPYKWYSMKRKNTIYAVTQINDGIKNRLVYMHRLILGLKTRCILSDHRDGNGLNNQRENLRASTISQNNSNRKSAGISRSKYLGVSFDKGKWKARIRSNKNQIHLGVFDFEIEAAKAYNEAAVKYHGEFARLNELQMTS